MRKNLLLTLGLAFAALTATAQTSFSDALDAKVGDNTYTTESTDSIFWKYTATQDEVIYVSGLNNTYDNTAVYVQKAGEAVPTSSSKALKGVNFSGKKNAYPLMQGQTAYFMAYNQGTVGFSLSTATMPGLGHGLASDDPLTIELGKEQYIGDAFKTGYASYDMYATYTATEDGVLVISTKSYISCTVNGTSLASSYTSNSYSFKVEVKSGETYSIIFNTYSPFIFSTEMTHPTPGSLDQPFSLVEGENSVPAEYGTYYYTYKPSKTGYMNINSTEALAGGQVKIYSSLSNITYKSPSASSATGSFDVRQEVAYVYSSTLYYVEVTKTETTDEVQKFTFAMEDYKQGEKESNPIVISSLPSTQTLSAASGKFYYTVTVPANTNKFLKIAATDASVTSTVYLYPKGYGQYYGVNGQGSVKADVSSTTEQTYIIYWNASESKAIEFTVSYEDIVKGSTVSNPLEAVKGDNKVPAAGDWYYTYTATQNGKLSITATPSMSVSFPTYNSEYGYWSTIDPTVNGSTYSIEATAGTTYYIYVQKAETDDVFVLDEAAFGEGESKATAIDLTEKGGIYTFGSENVGDIWFKYTVQKDGFMDAGTDVSYSSSYNVEFGKSTASYLETIIKSVSEGGDYVSIYATSASVKAGDTYLMHLSLGGASIEGKKVYFTERDANPGEASTNPLVLAQVGDKVATSSASASYDAPVWVKVVANGGDIYLASTAYCAGYYYLGTDAISSNNAEQFNTVYGNVSESDYDIVISNVAKGTEVYVAITRAWEDVSLTLTKNGDITTGINALNASAAQNGVEVFSLGGAKVADSIRGLAKGVYVVKAGGQTKKIVVK